MKRRSLCAWIIVGVGCSALFAQDDLRSLFGPEAPVMEVMAELAFPGSTIDWETQRLQGPGFEPKPVDFVGYTEEAWQEGFVAAAAIQFPGELREIVATALQEGDLQSRVTLSHVVLVRLASDRTIVDGRATALDLGGVATEVQSLFVFPSQEQEQEFPPVRVELKSLHAGDRWVASMVWSGTLGGDPLVATRLIPVLVSVRNTDGVVITEALELEEPSDTELILRGQNTGFTWSFTCDPGCIVPSEEILAEYRDRPILAD
jgi:hypothetical protein